MVDPDTLILDVYTKSYRSLERTGLYELIEQLAVALQSINEELYSKTGRYSHGHYKQ